MDTLKCGDIEGFKRIEDTDGDWWFPTLDRGAGCALHFAVAAGQLDAARFLVNERGVPVNQRMRIGGYTPLHICAQFAHDRSRPYLEIYAFLLGAGANPQLMTDECADDARDGGVVPPKTVYDLCVKRGRGWEPGRVRARLEELEAEFKDVEKKPATTYEGPYIGSRAKEVLDAWNALPKLYPPQNWLPPPQAGYADAQGMRDVATKGWMPAGTEGDGSRFVRDMTEEELKQQERDMDAYMPPAEPGVVGA